MLGVHPQPGCPIHAALSHPGVPGERFLLAGVDEWGY